VRAKARQINKGWEPVEYGKLETYAAQMIELVKNRSSIRPHRFKAQQDKIAFEIHRILKPSIRRLAAKKNMSRDLQDDIDQHSYIAICLALESWDQDIATFSTHVHWQVRAELQKLQHYEFPERRRLAIPTKIKFVELDKPMYGDQAESSTMADQLVDEIAEGDVEMNARRHVALHAMERVFSHLIARQMQSYVIGQDDEEKIARRRHSLMRNRWIYIRRTLYLENYEQIAQMYNVSRERVRQIISTTEDEIRGQLPRFCKKTNEILPATKMPPETVHPSWDYMLIDFYMATGEDTRILGTETPMPTRIEAYSFKPSVEIVITKNDEKADQKTNLPDNGANDNVRHEIKGDNVISMQKYQRKLKNGLTVAAIAGSMLSSVVAANAQSKAIPPEQFSENTTEDVSVKPKAKTKAAVGSSTPKDRIIPIVSMASVKMKAPAWGIKIAEYPTISEAKKSWYKDTKSWTWLRGLQPVYTADESKGSSSLAFGPLSAKQAEGMCHEAKRLSKPCLVIPFGNTQGKKDAKGARI
jgi:hypothetical protein